MDLKSSASSLLLLAFSATKKKLNRCSCEALKSLVRKFGIAVRFSANANASEKLICFYYGQSRRLIFTATPFAQFCCHFYDAIERIHLLSSPFDSRTWCSQILTNSYHRLTVKCIDLLSYGWLCLQFLSSESGRAIDHTLAPFNQEKKKIPRQKQFSIKCTVRERCCKSNCTMTTSTSTPSTNQFSSYDSNYQNYLCGFNQRLAINTATATTTSTSTTFASLVKTATVASDYYSNKQMIDASLPALKPDLQLNDTGLFTVYHFIKNFIG